MLIDILQHIIGAVLIFVLFFGIGFIVNMLIKTTWFPIWLYLIVVLPLAMWFGDFTVLSADFAVYGVGGLAGAALSGSIIRTLRRQGYKMF
jgi:hypothetical protein